MNEHDSNSHFDNAFLEYEDEYKYEQLANSPSCSPLFRGKALSIESNGELSGSWVVGWNDGEYITTKDGVKVEVNIHTIAKFERHSIDCDWIKYLDKKPLFRALRASVSKLAYIEWVCGNLQAINIKSSEVKLDSGDVFKINMDTYGEFTGVFNEDSTPIFEGDLYVRECGSRGRASRLYSGEFGVYFGDGIGHEADRIRGVTTECYAQEKSGAPLGFTLPKDLLVDEIALEKTKAKEKLELEKELELEKLKAKVRFETEELEKDRVFLQGLDPEARNSVLYDRMQQSCYENGVDLGVHNAIRQGGESSVNHYLRRVKAL